MTIGELLSRLNGVKRNGKRSMALCPAHDDHNPSLSINDIGDGRILVYCHAGCSFEQVRAALGVEPGALRPDEHTRQSLSESRRIATYDYTDEQGKLLFQVVRFEPKRFAPAAT